jgi:uncharacterized protein (DUF302 family)
MSAPAEPLVVRYVEDGRSHEPFQHLKIVELPFAAALDRLRAAIITEGLLVLHEIDPQAILARGGYALGEARQLLFFHPSLMARPFPADPAALLEAPLKFSVIAGEQGRVSIRWHDPSESFARYGDAALTQLGGELAETCRKIVNAAFGAD